MIHAPSDYLFLFTGVQPGREASDGLWRGHVYLQPRATLALLLPATQPRVYRCDGLGQRGIEHAQYIIFPAPNMKIDVPHTCSLMNQMTTEPVENGQ